MKNYTKPKLLNTVKLSPTIKGIDKAASLSSDNVHNMRTTPAGYPADE